MPSRKRSVENTLALSHSASANVVGLDSAMTSLALSDVSLVQHLIKTTSDTLTLSQAVSHNGLTYLYSYNNLAFTHNVASDGVKRATASNTLGLTQLADVQLNVRFLGDVLTLTHTVTGAVPKPVSTSNNLDVNDSNFDPDDLIGVDPNDPDAIAEALKEIGLRHAVGVRKSITVSSIQSYISLAQDAGQGPHLTPSNHIHLSHVAEVILHEDVLSRIYFNHEAVGHNVYWAEQTLDLTHSVLHTGILNRTVSTALSLNSVVSYLDIDFCGYTPGVGDGDVVFPAEPTLVRRASTVLTWPYASPTLTLSLRNPTFDNIEQFEFRRINRRSKGGTLDLFRDETWPKAKRLIYSFTELKDTQRAELLTFLIQSIGQEIGILDFESRQWKGVLLTPSNAISEPRSGGFSFSLDFEGELV